MKFITRDTDYAIRALLFIAKSEKEVFSVTTLNKSLKIPRAFLRKILQALQKNKVLRSIKGNNGGFILNKSTDKIFLIDLVKIFQKEVDLVQCIFRKNPCVNVKKCPLRAELKKIEAFAIKRLKAVTIGSLLQRR